jgi:hypothetical protein
MQGPGGRPSPVGAGVDQDDHTASLRAVRAALAQPASPEVHPGQAEPARKQRRRGAKPSARTMRPGAAPPADAAADVTSAGTLAIPSLTPPAGPGITSPAPDIAPPGPGGQPSRRGKRASGTRPKRGRPYRTVAIAGASAVMAGAVFLILTRSQNGATQTHVLSTPASLGCFTQEPQLAQQMQAKQLQQQIVAKSSGTAKNVIYAVYECPGTGEPQVILFIGGNLIGASPGSFISGFTSNLQGATATSAGSLGGDAACAPSVDGHPAVCAWADNDTFGAFVSANLGASSLANEMRQMRPQIERPADSATKQA